MLAGMIYVCGKREMPGHVRELRPSHLVSLVESENQPPTPEEIFSERHHRVLVDDVCESCEGCRVPVREDVEALISFLQTWGGSDPLLIHCMAGVSRSMAAALIALALPAEGMEHEAAQAMRMSAPHARPNPLIVALGDDLLGRHGRLVTAHKAMGEAAPLLVDGPLVRLEPLG